MGRWPNKYVIGLTGNIGMGKSTIRKMLEHLGAYTIDADGLAHQVMAPGAPAYQPVIDAFGKWILDANGRVDRTKLGAVAFAHPEALAKLESLTHPIVGQGIDTLVMRAKQPIIVIEAIKMVDGVLGSQVDAIWVVDAAPQIQLERLIKRGLTEYEARKRIDTQNPQRDKLARASVVISNSGTPEDAWVQVQREWNRILSARGVVDRPQDEVRQVQVRQQPAPVAAPVQPPTQPAATPPPAATVTTPTISTPAPTTAPTTPTTTPSIAQPAALQTPKTSIGTVPGIQPPSSTAIRPISPAKPGTGPLVPRPGTGPLVASQTMSVDIRRGMPKNADTIAQMINAATGKAQTRNDVMASFGEKSYLLAEINGKAQGLAGFQVENLITRMDEFIIAPDAPQGPIAEALIKSVEDASKELQSEVGFMFLPTTVAPVILQAFKDQEYAQMELDTIKVPAWREAAAESQPAGTIILAKKLRAERVLKPL